jgi:hypothetical protein
VISDTNMTGHHPVSKLFNKLTPARRAKVERLASEMAAEMPLQSLRRALDLSQVQLAETLNLDQPGISRLEKQTDMLVSTLGRYISAMGGRLEIRAVFPQGEVAISGLGDIRKSAALAKSTALAGPRPRRTRRKAAAPVGASR